VAPEPKWWHAPDSDSTECEVSELVAELVIETGSAFGHTTALIAHALRRNGHGHLVSLEPDPGRAEVARSRVASYGLGAFCEVREQSSLDFTPPQEIDFAWFDSLYELRAEEFRRFRPWLSPGGIVAFHDWTSGLRGHYLDVRAEVEALAAEGLLRPVFVPSPRGIVVAEVL
jgi:predicted O-methyltransferase YrrM